MTDDERQTRRKAFIDRWKHELSGMVLDAMTPRDGSHASMFARQILTRVDVKLAAIFDELMPAGVLPVNNGVAQGVRR